MEEVDAIEREATEEESLIDWKSMWKPMAFIVGLFVVFFWLPRLAGSYLEGFLANSGSRSAVSGQQA